MSAEVAVMTEIPDIGPSIPVAPEEMFSAALTLAERSLQAGDQGAHQLAYFLSCVGLASLTPEGGMVSNNALNSEGDWLPAYPHPVKEAFRLAPGAQLDNCR